MSTDESPAIFSARARMAAWRFSGRALGDGAVPLALALLGLLGGLTPARSAAQQGEQLVGYRSSDIGVIYESWRFGDDGIIQPGADGFGSVRITSVSQLSLPISVAVPLGDRWTLDVAGAYASSTVKLAARDSAVGSDRYTLSGLTDVRLRATGRLVGDNLLVTFGLNAPTGRTSLDAEQFSALRVIAAPALSFQSPVLGTGTSATAGVVYARQIANWAWAVGTSYEIRRKYAPVTIAAGLPAPDFSPGNALHLSLGADGLIGQNGMTFGVSADFFGTSELAAAAGAPGGTGASASRLGPIYTFDWQFRVAARGFRELTLYAVDRYRSSYEREGETVAGSSGNYLDAGAQGIYSATPSTGVLVALNLRHHSGLSADDALATAATRSGALTLGVVRDLPRGYSLRPFVRGQFGTIKSGENSASATSLAGGIALGLRF